MLGDGTNCTAAWAQPIAVGIAPRRRLQAGGEWYAGSILSLHFSTSHVELRRLCADYCTCSYSFAGVLNRWYGFVFCIQRPAFPNERNPCLKSWGLEGKKTVLRPGGKRRYFCNLPLAPYSCILLWKLVKCTYNTYVSKNHNNKKNIFIVSHVSKNQGCNDSVRERRNQ
jgi:hypothetical protein